MILKETCVVFFYLPKCFSLLRKFINYSQRKNKKMLIKYIYMGNGLTVVHNAWRNLVHNVRLEIVYLVVSMSPIIAGK